MDEDEELPRSREDEPSLRASEETLLDLQDEGAISRTVARGYGPFMPIFDPSLMESPGTEDIPSPSPSAGKQLPLLAREEERKSANTELAQVAHTMGRVNNNSRRRPTRAG